jgi:hypothetical protein
VPRGQELVDNVAADKTRSAGHKHSHKICFLDVLGLVRRHTEPHWDSEFSLLNGSGR